MKIKNLDLNSILDEDDFEFDEDDARRRRLKVRPPQSADRQNTTHRQHTKPRRQRHAEDFYGQADV